jgi:hypothetical protein
LCDPSSGHHHQPAIAHLRAATVPPPHPDTRFVECADACNVIGVFKVYITSYILIFIAAFACSCRSCMSRRKEDESGRRIKGRGAESRAVRASLCFRLWLLLVIALF